MRVLISVLVAGLVTLLSQVAVHAEVPLVDLRPSAVGVGPSGVGDDFEYWGTAGGIRGFGVAATICNIGTGPAESLAGITARHPMISFQLYRLLDGRFEQVGLSWVKHMFCGGNKGTCGSCQPTDCNSLGVGCADTYTASTNSFGSGPRWSVNPQGVGLVDGHAATHTHPFDAPTGPPEIAGMLQVNDLDIVAGAAGGLFFIEAQYVTHDESPSLRHDNAVWRPVDVTLTAITGAGVVHPGESAIEAWKAHDPFVEIAAIDVPGDGRFHLGCRVTSNGDGTWDYEYALHNLNSDRAAGAFAVPVGANVAVSATGFHDVGHHSGDGVAGVDQDGTDWPATVGSLVRWGTDHHLANPNANALRWGTLYNYRLTADAPPRVGEALVGLFKSGGIPSVTVETLVPQGCLGDVDGDGAVATSDFLDLLGAWGPNPGHPADLDGDGDVATTDMLMLLGRWGPCPLCGDVQAGDCFTPAATQGCADGACCTAVCAVDPKCCEVAWTQQCVDTALVLCQSCGDPAAGSCTVANGTPYCSDQLCCEAVCAVDPSCCDVAWTQSCVNQVSQVCNGCGGAGTGDCCEANGTPYCEDAECCTLVCNLFPACCSGEWASLCAILAADGCDGCMP